VSTLPLEPTPLPPEPQFWFIKETNAERLHAISAFGFTDRQSRFLLEVLLHSGVFLERQYCQFAGIVHGQKSTDFIRSLADRQFATPIAPGKLHRGRMFHLHYKPLWTAIREPDSRFRKRAAPGRLIERVMLLDAVLDDRSMIWLGPSTDKRRHFTSHLRDRYELADLPRLQFGHGPRPTYRHFPDKLPIGDDPERTDHHVFVYLVTTPVPWDFRLFLLRHVPLLSKLTRWTIRLLFPKPLVRAQRGYLHAAREHLMGTTRGRNVSMIERMFRDRMRQTQPNPGPSYTEYQEDGRAFSGSRFQALYRQWLVDPERTLWMADSHILADAIERGLGRVECVELRRQYLHLSPLVDVA
jgi:hypothetical protein